MLVGLERVVESAGPNPDVHGIPGFISVQRESVNSSRPEFLPMMRPRQSTRQRSRPTISNRKAPLSAGLLFNSSSVPSPISHYIYHLLMASILHFSSAM
jgi:hypothetical protein